MTIQKQFAQKCTGKSQSGLQSEKSVLFQSFLYLQGFKAFYICKVYNIFFTGFKLRNMIWNYIIYKLRKQMTSSSYQFQHLSSTSQRRPYHRIGQDEKNNLIYEVFQNKQSISKASHKLGINNSTAKVLIRKYKQSLKKKQKLQKITSVQENLCTSIQQQLPKTTPNQIQAPIFFIMASPAYFNWGSNYPVSIAPPFISYFPNSD